MRDSPPPIVLICSGEMEIDNAATLLKRISESSYLISVDGGLAHCQKLNLHPQFIIGDFDSVDPNILQSFAGAADFTSLPRAKDCTDLEAAIEKAKILAPNNPFIIWGGLGGRLDHTLNNIYLLLRLPGQLFLESEQQLLVGATPHTKPVAVDGKAFKTMTLVALSGSANHITIECPGQTTLIESVHFSKPYIFPIDQVCEVSVKTGELIVILDKRNILPLPHDDLLKMDTPIDFSLNQPLAHIFQKIGYLSTLQQPTKLYSCNAEEIHLIQQTSGNMTFPCQKGQTISLIPIDGAAHAVTTSGLRWNLNAENGYTTLDKNFLSVSNVALGTSFSISIGQGKILCIINGFIDLEMVDSS